MIDDDEKKEQESAEAISGLKMSWEQIGWKITSKDKIDVLKKIFLRTDDMIQIVISINMIYHIISKTLILAFEFWR